MEEKEKRLRLGVSYSSMLMVRWRRGRESSSVEEPLKVRCRSMPDRGREVKTPRPLQKSCIDWANFSGHSARTSPTSSILRREAFCLLQFWCIVWTVCTCEALAPVTSRVSTFSLDSSLPDKSDRLRKASTYLRRFLGLILLWRRS